MSEFHVQVVRIGKVLKHPNADTLSITNISTIFPNSDGYPVVFHTDDYKEGDLAVYLPIDSIVPDTEKWNFLAPKGTPVGQVPEKYRRIKAKKFRGVFSMGILSKLPSYEDLLGEVVNQEQCDQARKELAELALNASKLITVPREDKEYMEFLMKQITDFERVKFGFEVGDDVRHLMNIKKYEPSLPKEFVMQSENEPDPGFIPVYTDIEGLRKFPDILKKGEEVVITEKIHGANARYVYRDGRLWVGSHHGIKKFDERNLWWKVAIEQGLEEKLKKIEGYVVYGEVFGNVQDLKYGVNGVTFRAFDVLGLDGRFLDYDDACGFLELAEIQRVPLLYRGPWNPDDRNLYCEGSTTLGVDHTREGFVVKPTKERFDQMVGRVILKMVGEGYLLRKGA